MMTVREARGFIKKYTLFKHKERKKEMKGKITALFMAMALTAGCLAGCGNSENGAASGSSTGSDSGAQSGEASEAADAGEELEDIADIVVAYPMTYAPQDVQTVEDALNEITEAKINTHVTLSPFDLGTYNEQINLMISGSEKLDAMVTFFYGSTEFTSMASQNQLEPLDDLLAEYGQGILETLPEQYMATTKINGQTVGVPVYKDNVATVYLAMRTDILDKYNLTEQAQNIQSVDDIEAILQTVKDNEPSLVPMFVQKDMGVLTQGMFLTGDLDDVVIYEPLYQEQIVSIPEDDPTVAQAVYDTEYYKDAVVKMHDWYEKGLLFRDSATTELVSTTAISSNTAFAMVFAAENATMMSTVQDCGYEMTVIPLAYQNVTSQKISQLDWVIPVTSTEPEAAMKFMNLLYTDADVVNLLNYGVEGVHYVKNDNGTISFPEGKDMNSVGYYGNLSFFIGNQYLSYVWDNYDPDTRAKSLEINENATYSPLIGFTFDSSAFANEISAVSNVVAEYHNTLVSGMAEDPEAMLEEFRNKLNDSGMPTLVAGVQEQLDAWIAENGLQTSDSAAASEAAAETDAQADTAQTTEETE